MQLLNFQVSNFRCLKDVSLSLHELSILIGENDAGKSSFLDALEIALNGNAPDKKDYFMVETELDGEGNYEITTAENIEFILRFALDVWDYETYSAYIAADSNFYLRRHFSGAGNKTFYKAQKYENELLNQKHERLTAVNLNELLQTLKIAVPEGRQNQESRLALLKEYMEKATTVEDWIEIKFKDLRDILPIFQRYRAMDYVSPENLVRKTLEAIYEGIIFEDEEGQRRPIESLRELRSTIDRQVNLKIGELVGYISMYSSKIRDVKIDTDLDLSKGLRIGEFLVEDGHGSRSLSKVGDGTKRRILMGTMDWDRSTVQTTLNHQSIIRAYDEPDTNLHYEAQRKMFNVIAQVVQFNEEQKYRVQALVCTHSLLMVDSAPATSINLLVLADEGHTNIDTLKVDDDGHIEEFLDTLARELGITNSMLFYERCYLLVEGDTEVNALPLIYRRIYGTSILNDGIRIINLHGHGAWLSMLQLLSKNRQDITLTLLDTDAYQENLQKLTEAGFDMKIFDKQCFWSGTNEFEDGFSDACICECLNLNYPRMHNEKWYGEDIAAIRTKALESNKKRHKFSTLLEHTVNDGTLGGTEFAKAEFGYILGQTCPIDQLPDSVTKIFELARKISGAN